MTRHDTKPLFTVIIPTKNRAAYLHQTLRTCSLQEYENLAIIVSDDGSTDNTREIVEDAARKDPRISYVTPGTGVGMLDNFEFALEQVKPGYVLALGGDDGLMPHGIRGMLDVLRDTGQEMLAWPTPTFYYANTRTGLPQMIIRLEHGRPYTSQRIISSQSFLERQARELYYVGDVESPMFYVKGVVSTHLVDQVRHRSGGRFYSCATPDGYSGIVLAGEVSTYAFSGVPFTLHGVSPTSAGLGYLAGSEEAKKQSEEFFKTASSRPMHAELGSQPYSPLISLMTADYLLTCRDLPGWPGVAPKIDFRSLLLKALAELEDGLFASDRVARELAVMHGIAEHHGLGSFLRERVRRARRNSRETLNGTAFSSSRLYIDANQHGIENVFDAAYFAYVVHRLSSAMTFSTVRDAVKNSIGYKMLSYRKSEPFPAESEWIRGASGDRTGS